MLFSLAYLGKGFTINLETLPDEVLNMFWDMALERIENEKEELERIKSRG